MFDLIASAWLTITRHRLRSTLAIAGVAVGVCALTSVMSVEQAWRRAVIRYFSKMDLETVIVENHGGRKLRAGFTPEDVRAIGTQCPAVESATLMTWQAILAEHEGYGLQVAVRAAEPNFTIALPDRVREGRVFTEQDAAARAPVCVLSLKTRLFLFGEEPAVGSDLRIGGFRFRVIGVITGKGHLGVGEEGVYVPITWARALFNEDPYKPSGAEVFARTRDPRAASAQINQLLRRRIGGDKDRSFTSSLWEVREAALHSRNRATFYSGMAAICALLAAGVGIAALLFVSVSERVTEIGICRALGASRIRVYGEQLAAALMLSAGGGLIGALAGIPAAATGAFATRWQPLLPRESSMLGHNIAEFPRISEIGLSVDWTALVIAIALAVLTGAVSALAPASEAARIEPAPAIARRPGSARRAREILTCLQVAFGIVVLVVLTSYFALLQNEERTEARRRLGEDRLSAIADPVAALREPVEDRRVRAWRDALAQVLASPDNLFALKRKTPLVKDLVPMVPLVLDLAWGGRSVNAAQVVFTTADFLNYRPKLDAGEPERIEESFNRGEPAVVIDPRLTEQLFADQDPVGRTISIAGKKFTVVGVRRNWDYHPNGTAWAPIGFYAGLRNRARHDFESGFYFTATRVDSRPLDERQYELATAQLRDALLPMLPKEYRKGILLSEQIPETTKQFIFQNKAIAARGAIGALAVLLVALIGLANMLLVSVHDEVRETGIRRAFGATRADVFLHFLSQGVLLSALGAVAGLAIGEAVCAATRSWAGMPLSVSVFWAGAGAVATVLAGTLTSVAPALVAARVHPVEALRYE